jgi:Pectate lyase superfamily protein
MKKHNRTSEKTHRPTEQQEMRGRIAPTLVVCVVSWACALTSTGEALTRDHVGELGEEASEASGVLNVKIFGAKGDGTNDDTKAIQSAIDAALPDKAAVVWFPPGVFTASQIILRQGISLLGSGINPAPHGLGTTIQQKPGTDLDLIISDQPRVGYHHWSKIENIRLMGAKGAVRSSGIKFATATGEGMKFEHLFVSGFGGDGIQVSGGVPFYAEDLHLFGNGVESGQGYGLNIVVSGSAPSETYELSLISGDNNALGLIHLAGASGIGDHQEFFVHGVKAEKHIPGRQNDVIVVENMNGTPVVVIGLSANNNSGELANSLIKIVGSNARLSWFGINGDNKNPNGFRYFVNDTYNKRNFTASAGTSGTYAGSYFFDALNAAWAGSHFGQAESNGDLAGTISISGSASAAHRFATSFNAPPVCTVSPTSDPRDVKWWVVPSQRDFTIHLSAAATITFNYQCVGNPN